MRSKDGKSPFLSRYNNLYILSAPEVFKPLFFATDMLTPVDRRREHEVLSATGAWDGSSSGGGHMMRQSQLDDHPIHIESIILFGRWSSNPWPHERTYFDA